MEHMLFIAAIAILCFAIRVIAYYLEKRNKQQMPFRSFKALYNIAPKKWRVDSDCPHYFADAYSIYGDEIYMSTFCGYLRYWRFVNTISRRQKHEKVNDDTKRLVQCWQEDIDRYKENAEKEVQNLVRCITEHKG